MEASQERREANTKYRVTQLATAPPGDPWLLAQPSEMLLAGYKEQPASNSSSEGRRERPVCWLLPPPISQDWSLPPGELMPLLFHCITWPFGQLPGKLEGTCQLTLQVVGGAEPRGASGVGCVFCVSLSLSATNVAVRLALVVLIMISRCP